LGRECYVSAASGAALLPAVVVLPGWLGNDLAAGAGCSQIALRAMLSGAAEGL